MPDASGNIKGIALGGRAGAALERLFPRERRFIVRLEDGSAIPVAAPDEHDAVLFAGARAGQDVAHLVREVEEL